MMFAKILILLLVFSFANAESDRPEKEVERSGLPVSIYKALEGSTLKKTLFSWCKNNNYTLSWKVESDEGDMVDWKIDKDIIIKDTFYGAVLTLLGAYKSMNSQLAFNKTFYRNRVLRVYLEDAL
jgi:hypothetical protein